MTEQVKPENSENPMKKNKNVPPAAASDAAGVGQSRNPEDSEIGLVSRSEYNNLKRRAITFEDANDRFLLVIPCSGNDDWCEMGENSALFYKYIVCDKIGAKVSIHDDYDDHYTQFSIGYVRSRGFDLIRNRVKQAGLYKAEIIKSRCLIIELKKKVSDKVIKHLRQLELEEQQGINEVVTTKPLDPVLYQKMLEVATRLHRLALRKFDRLSSETNGVRMIETMDMMIADYHKLSNDTRKLSDVEKLEIWCGMREAIQSEIVELQIVAGERLWKRDVCVSVGQSLVEIKKRIENRIARLEKKVAPKKTRKKEENDEKEAKPQNQGAEDASARATILGAEDRHEDDAAAEARSDRRESGSRESEDGGVSGLATEPTDESVRGSETREAENDGRK